MARLRCDFFSDVLGLSTSMTVILPTGGAAPDGAQVLYLLHGLSDDDTAWTRNTSLERYVDGLGLAVVMPQAHHSFYTDEHHGLPFWTFLTGELPDVVNALFRVSDRREDTFVAGLSMGGYGALKWALREPWRFAAAASLSGALGLSDESEDADFAELMGRVFGPAGITGSDNDVAHLLGATHSVPLPELYVACGTEDFLYPQNVAFIEAAHQCGVPLTTAIGPGDHDWAYWDAGIQDVLAWLPRENRQAPGTQA